METFDPQTQLWHCEDDGCSSQQRAVFHFPNLPEGRRECAAVSLGECIYILGGWKSSGATNEVLILNTATRLWTNGPRMQTRRRCLGVAVLHGKIYAAGGCVERSKQINCSSHGYLKKMRTFIMTYMCNRIDVNRFQHFY